MGVVGRTARGTWWTRRPRPLQTTAVGAGSAERPRTEPRIRFRRRRRHGDDDGRCGGGAAAAAGDGRPGEAARTAADSPAVDTGDEIVRSAVAAWGTTTTVAAVRPVVPPRRLPRLRGRGGDGGRHPTSDVHYSSHRLER